MKPLYGSAEAKNHYFEIYLDHYKEKLRIKMLLYNACLFITKYSGENIVITGPQTKKYF